MRPHQTPSRISHHDYAQSLVLATGQPIWVTRYRDGHEVGEWECAGWHEVNQTGAKELRLYCPSGEMAKLETLEWDAAGRLFHLGKARMSALGDHRVLARLIGILDDTEGRCTCFLWTDGRLLGPIQDRFPDLLCLNAVSPVGDTLLLGIR